MAKVFIIMFIVFIVLGLAALIHAFITAPTLDPDTNRFIHWRKAKAYFKKKNSEAVKEAIAEALVKSTARQEKIVTRVDKVKGVDTIPMTIVNPKKSTPSKKMKPLIVPVPKWGINKDGSVRKRPGPKPGSHNKKK